MTTELPETGRCPSCGAAVRVGDPWCTLCYADLRPAPPVVEPVVESPAPSQEVGPLEEPSAYRPSPVGGPDPLTAPINVVASPIAGPSWPCPACGTVNPMADDVCSACGRHFLAGARDDSPLLELPVVGDITKLSRGSRFGIAFGVILAFIFLTVILGLIFG